MDQPAEDEFRPFFLEVEPRLRRALCAALGPQLGKDATLEGMSWAWEHWSKAQSLDDPVAYLFRVGQSKVRRRKEPLLSASRDWRDPMVEPELPTALADLTESQRLAVVLIHAFGWTFREVSELTGTSISTVQKHLERGLSKLRIALSVEDDHG